MRFPMGSFTAIVGESGCGKSTIAAVLMGRNKGYTGSVTIGKTELANIAEDSLMKNLTYISHQSYLFKGTVRDNLLMGKPDATDEELWSVLKKAKLADFMKSENGLDTRIQEKGSNLSGGQCQRLALARALLHDSPVYIFDEATSNIDVESENDIMEQIHELAEAKTVILISHRLANMSGADYIYVMESGCVVEGGTHEELLARKGVYEKLWTAQQELENYVGKEA
jgi:ABC-type multidrug transport system fused ATPase/permease subunit